MNKDKYAQ